jgi:hypothetical protein
MADWYPQSGDGMAVWWANFLLRRVDFESKYPVLHDMAAELIADGAWIAYWVGAKHSADDLRQQLTKYFNTIAGSDTRADPPSPIVWTLPGGAPTEVPPGIEKRIRDVRRDVVGSMNYATADGEALGFESAEAAKILPEDMTAAFDVRTLATFEVQITFRKRGMNAMRFEYRYKGGNWLPAGTLINSPGNLAIPPSSPGIAEQIELRGVYLEGNSTFGNFSDAKSALIAP